MTTYNLDQTSATYISAIFNQGTYSYRMVSIKGESNYNHINDLDLRKDKLIVYGTEIKESKWEKLHNSLLFRLKAGKLYIDCNGACYIIVYHTNNQHTFYKLTDNVIFDWSKFGVIVPNSVNDSLRKQLQQKDQELITTSSLLSSAKDEALGCQKQWQKKDVELQKVLNQLDVKEFELNATKIKFELSKEELKEFQDRASNSNVKDYKNLELELEKVHHQLSSVKSELETTKMVWEFSKEQLLSCKKENEEMKFKVQTMQDQVFRTVADLKSERVVFESRLLSCQMEYQDVATELKLTKSLYETSQKKIIQLEKQVSSGEMVQDQLSLIMNKLRSFKVLVDFTAGKRVDLEDECFYENYVTKGIEIVDE